MILRIAIQGSIVEQEYRQPTVLFYEARNGKTLDTRALPPATPQLSFHHLDLAYTSVQVDGSTFDFSPSSRRFLLVFQIMLLQVGCETKHHRKIMRLEDFLGYGEDNSPVKPRQRWGLGAEVIFWLSSNPTTCGFREPEL